MNVTNPFLVNLPIIDLHDETSETAIYRLQEFINEQVIIGHNKIIAIHGIGQGILRASVRDYISQHRQYTYELDIYNDGMTIINIK